MEKTPSPKIVKMFGKEYPIIKWDTVHDAPFTIELPDKRQRSRIGKESLFHCRVCKTQLEDTDYVTVCQKCDDEDIAELDSSLIRTKQLEKVNELFDSTLFDIKVNGTPLYEAKEKFQRMIDSEYVQFQTDMSLYDILFLIKTRVDTAINKLDEDEE